MVTPQLIDYIKSELTKGQTPGAIKQLLITRQWQQPDIDQAFLTINRPKESPVASINIDIKSDMRSKWIMVIKYYLYVLCVLGFISFSIFLWIMYRSFQDLRIVVLFIFPYAFFVVMVLALKNSQKLWGKYALTLVTMALWFLFFRMIFFRTNIINPILSLFMLMWNVPFTILTYLNFKK